MTRELVVLGTAAQVPTRTRNHNGYLLRWDDVGFLFDPGEGTQRQMQLAGVSASSVNRICLTHTHGDHCLGLPGVTAAQNRPFQGASATQIEAPGVTDSERRRRDEIGEKLHGLEKRSIEIKQQTGVVSGPFRVRDWQR